MTLNITALWDALGWAILHSLWQGALIGFIVWAVRALATDRRAWLRYLAGMGGLVATFSAFLATFMVLSFDRAKNWAPVEFANGPEAGAPTELTLSISVLPVQIAQAGLTDAVVPWLGMVWAVGFAFLSLQAYRAYTTTRFLATQGLRSPGTDWTSRFTVLIKRSRTNERIRLFVSEHVSGPMTLGALRPIVLVPVGFLTALPPAQIEAILLHELAHIRRHDFLFGLIQTAIRTVLYFNPAVIMISRQIDEDREQACDDIAVTITGGPSDLVRGLAALRLGPQAPAMVMAADGGPLLTRLNRLMGRPASRSASSRLTAAAVSALILGTAACSTVSMAHPHLPAAPESPEPPVSPELRVADTIVRAKTDAWPKTIVVSADALPPMPVMPVMPAIPATPVLPAVPVPVFSDYDSADAFEVAMEAWGEKMDLWGEEVELRFEGEWEDAMEAWGEEMEVWGESVEALSENYEGHPFTALAELGELAQLADLGDLADLASLQNGAIIFDGRRVEAKAEEIKARVLRSVDVRQRQAEMFDRQADNIQRSKDQAKRAKEQAKRAQRQTERAQEQAERAQEQVERAQKRARNATKSRSYSSSQTRHTVSGSDRDNTISINGRTINIPHFRNTLMAALVEDGLADRGDRTVSVALCKDGSLTVDGKNGSKAQYKRYKALFAKAGLDVEYSVDVHLKPDALTLSLSGPGKHDKGLKMTFGTTEHTNSK